MVEYMSLKMKIAKNAKKYVHHKWYIFFSSAIVCADFFVPLFPSTTFVIASSMLKPKKWLTIGVSYALATALGGMVFISLVQSLSETVLTYFIPSLTDVNSFSKIKVFIQNYGVYGLFLLACTPLPIRTVSIITAILGGSILHITLAILAGRLLIYIALSFASSRFPAWLLNRPAVRRSPFLIEVFKQPAE